MYRKMVSLLAVFAICAPSYADQFNSSLVNLDEIVVTATRYSEGKSSVPANVTVITEDKIRNSAAENIPELLRTVPGVFIQDITGNGRNFTVDLRGVGETAALNTLVLVDGRRINQPDLSGTDWTLIPKDRVARIEIVRGGRGSVFYGDNAAGGVVNIITKKGQQALSATTRVSAGSYDTYSGNFDFSGPLGPLRYALNGNYRHSDGYRDNSDTEAKDFGLALDWDFSEKHSFNFSSGYHSDKTGLPGALTQSQLDSGVSRKSTFQPDDFADTEDWYLMGGGQFFLNEDSYVEATISTRKRDSDFFSSFIGGQYRGSTEINTFAFSPQLVLNPQLLDRKLGVVLGFDYENTQEDILNQVEFPPFPATSSLYDLERENFGYFAHVELPATERIVLSLGARKEKADYDLVSVSTPSSESTSFDEELLTLGAVYHLSDPIRLFANYSKSFRYPVLDEIFNFTDNSINESLKPQTSDDYAIGLSYDIDPSASVSLTLFYTKTEKELFYNPSGGAFGFGANENLDGDALRQGFEIFGSKTLKSIELTAGYTFKKTEIDGGQYDGKEIPNVPKHLATIGIQKMFGDKITIGLDGIYVGQRRFISDFSNNAGKLDDYLFMRSKLSYAFDTGKAYLVINNLLDQEYSEYGALNFTGEQGYYPSPPINFLAGVDISF